MIQFLGYFTLLCNRQSLLIIWCLTEVGDTESIVSTFSDLVLAGGASDSVWPGNLASLPAAMETGSDQTPGGAHFSRPRFTSLQVSTRLYVVYISLFNQLSSKMCATGFET